MQRSFCLLPALIALFINILLANSAHALSVTYSYEGNYFAEMTKSSPSHALQGLVSVGLASSTSGVIGISWAAAVTILRGVWYVCTKVMISAGRVAAGIGDVYRYSWPDSSNHGDLTWQYPYAILIYLIFVICFQPALMFSQWLSYLWLP